MVTEDGAMRLPAACLFDLDGLLLDTEPLQAQAWQQAARHFGRSLSDAELLMLRGRRRHDCAEQVLRWLAASAPADALPSRDDLLAYRQPIAETLLRQAAPMAGARALVEQCRRLDVPMALATSSAKAAVQLKTEPHAWLNWISVRVHGDDPELQRGKPAPDVFLLAAQRLGVAAADCWALEDSPSGAQAALAAGCCVHVVPPAGLSALQRQTLYPGINSFVPSLEALVLPLENLVLSTTG
jgi:pseudouridine-5'-monophosphatase